MRVAGGDIWTSRSMRAACVDGSTTRGSRSAHASTTRGMITQKNQHTDRVIHADHGTGVSGRKEKEKKET